MNTRTHTHFTTLVLALLLSACAAERDDRTVITFWAMGAEGERVQPLVDQFEAENPDIRVRLQRIPWTAAHEKLLTAFAGNATPDVAQLGNTWVPEFVALNALEDLQPWIDGSAALPDTAFFPGIWDTNVIDGEPFGIPWYIDTRVLFYRTDLFDRAGHPNPPSTWDEWRAAAHAVAEATGRYAIYLATEEWQPAVIFGLQTDSELLRDQWQYGDFQSSEFREAFTFLIDFYRSGLSPVGATEIINVHQSFADGVFAMYITGPWNVGEFNRRLPERLQDAWTTAPLPGPDGAPGVSVAGGASLVMFRRSRKKEAAWQLVEFLSRPESQLEFYRLTGNLPPRPDVWQDSSLAADDRLMAFRKQLDHVRPLPKVPEIERIVLRVRHYAEGVARGAHSIDDALRFLDRDVDQMLEKRRWILANIE